MRKGSRKEPAESSAGSKKVKMSEKKVKNKSKNKSDEKDLGL